MFNFFEGMIEKIGVKLVSDFTSKLIEFIHGVVSNKNNNNDDNGSDNNLSLQTTSIFEKNF